MRGRLQVALGGYSSVVPHSGGRPRPSVKNFRSTGDGDFSLLPAVQTVVGPVNLHSQPDCESPCVKSAEGVGDFLRLPHNGR